MIDYLCSLCGLRLPVTGADCGCVRSHGDNAKRRIDDLERALDYALAHYIRCECGGAGRLIHVHKNECPKGRVMNLAAGLDT